MKQGPLRVLVIPNTVFFPPYLDELPEREQAGLDPHAWITDVAGEKTYLDQRLLTHPPAWRRRIYRRLPFWLVQVLEAYRTRGGYDVVLCWSVADVTLCLALLLKLTRQRVPVVALLTRVSEAKKARLLKRVHSHVSRIVLPPAVQRQFAVDVLHIPRDKLVALPWTVDTRFWQAPPEVERTTICAAGGEMRDYATLIQAMDGLDIPCHIAGSLDQARRDWWNDRPDGQQHELPPNVTIGPMPPAELRDLYARSRFVVVPLRPTDSDNGITSMNEAWSMSRPVICSAVAGQRDAFVAGTHGEWVPVADVTALREAIVDLWDDPQRAARMGREGRRLVEETYDHHVFSDGISAVLSEVAAAAARSEPSRH